MRSAARHSLLQYLRISIYNPYSIVNERKVAKTNIERNRVIVLKVRLLTLLLLRWAELVELIGIEPTTLCLQSRCSPS
jgi:hypothetical protein